MSRKIRSDIKIGNLEKKLGLTKGAIRNPDGTDARSDKKLGTLREEYQRRFAGPPVRTRTDSKKAEKKIETKPKSEIKKVTSLKPEITVLKKTSTGKSKVVSSKVITTKTATSKKATSKAVTSKKPSTKTKTIVTNKARTIRKKS